MLLFEHIIEPVIRNVNEYRIPVIRNVNEFRMKNNSSAFRDFFKIGLSHPPTARSISNLSETYACTAFARKLCLMSSHCAELRN